MGEVRDFLLPDLGEGLEEAEILTWYVDVGDRVELNQDICEVETAKADVGVPCPFSGTVVERFAEVGQTLQVGRPLIRIEVEESSPDAEDVAHPDESSEVAAATHAAPFPAAEESARALDLDTVEVEGDTDGAGPPSARSGEPSTVDAPGERVEAPSAGSPDEEPHVIVGYGPAEGRPPLRHAPIPRAVRSAQDGSGRPRAKPPVRKLAKDLGVDLGTIPAGSGPDGTITRGDVYAAAALTTRSAPITAAATSTPSAPSPPSVTLGPTAAPDIPSAPTEPEGDTAPGFRGLRPGDLVPLKGIRRRISDKMRRAQGEIPAASASLWVDCAQLWDLAGRLTDASTREGRPAPVTPFVLLLRAVALALPRFPTLNARLDEEAEVIRLLREVHLGVAVDTPRGLLVAVLRDAASRSTHEVATGLAGLKSRARDGTIGPEELTGSTFTVTNYGALGADDGLPIINHPEAAILGVGAMKERPWVVDGQLAVRRAAKLTCVFDHRISDGGEAGGFLAVVGQLVEDPATMLLDA